MERTAYAFLTFLSFWYFFETFFLLFDGKKGLLIPYRGIILLGIVYGLLLQSYAIETIYHRKNRRGHLFPIFWGVGLAIAEFYRLACPTQDTEDAFFLFEASAVTVWIVWIDAGVRKFLKHEHPT